MSDDALRQFLSSRRAQLDPESVGLPASPSSRRKPGLRREEVAALAGISVDYYARLEQGRVGHVSEQVLHAVETALRLDRLEREHLRALVSASGKKRHARDSPTAASRPRHGLRSLVEAMNPIPAMLQNRRLDVLHANHAARILLTDFEERPLHDRNIVRWLFLEPEARSRYADWPEVAATTVAALRAAHDPRVADPELTTLIGELSVASPEFARYWADYRLFKHSHGKKVLHHDLVGEFTVNYETLDVSDSDDLRLCIYTADVGSPSDEKLRMLLSWHAESSPLGADRPASTEITDHD